MCIRDRSILEKTGGGLFLLGSKPGVAELAAQKMTEKHPKLYICGNKVNK